MWGAILTFPDTLTTQGLSLWCFNNVGGETFDLFPDALVTTQGLSLDGRFQHSAAWRSRQSADRPLTLTLTLTLTLNPYPYPNP